MINGIAQRLLPSRRPLVQDVPGANGILMGHVLHDWVWETKRMLKVPAPEFLPQVRKLLWQCARELILFSRCTTWPTS